MKTLILSDVHSNLPALEAILRKEADADRIYCAGDLVDWGPFPQQVIAWMKAHKVTCVRGNHDTVVIDLFRSGKAAGVLDGEGDFSWAEHNAALLTAEDIAYLENLPECLTLEMDGHSYGLTHLYRGYEELVSLSAFDTFREAAFPSATGEPPLRLIFGHTHRQSIRQFTEDRLWINPGSVSYRRPDDPDQTAHYALIQEGRISLHRCPYSVDKVYQAMQGLKLNQGAQNSAWFFGSAEVRARRPS